MNSELKAKINERIEKISNIVKLDVTQKDVNKEIDKFYMMGHRSVEVQFSMDIPTSPTEKAFLKEYTFDNIKSLNDDMRDEIRKQISIGTTNNESVTDLIKRVSKIVTKNKNRAEMIVRTETNRTYNVGRQKAAENSGMKLKKYVNVALDERTSPICRRMNAKYGDEEKGIPMNQKFYDETSGQKFLQPPFHVNCRTRASYVPY